jgi:23S rRNA (uracil1939-C5)-methyltransferase
VGAQGDGIAPYEGGHAYIPFTAPGDVIEAQLVKTGPAAWRGELLDIVSEGDARKSPACRHFGSCGGCSLQHLSNNYYARWTRQRIETALSHQGISGINIKSMISSPAGCRRRLDIKSLRTGNEVLLGFHARKTKDIVDITECPVAASELVALFEPLRAIFKSVLHKKQGASARLTVCDNGVSVLLGLPREPDLALRESLATFAHTHDLAAFAIDVDGFTEPMAERRVPTVTLGNIGVKLPAGAFIQATKEGEEALQAAVTAAVAGADSVVDLFCGLGTFAFAMAKQVKVHAVEGDKAMLDALKDGANHAGGLKPISTEHRDLFRRPLLVEELDTYDAVVFDPPRAGAKDQVAVLAASKVPLVVGVSCNPNTFGRDARTLIDGGYELISIQPVDQFLWSHHVELVGVFRRA